MKYPTDVCPTQRFVPPRIFTNALLHQHDITALIRDTEAHERALFTVHPSVGSHIESPQANTVFNVNGHSVNTDGRTTALPRPRRNNAVVNLLGPKMVDQIRKAGGGGVSSGIGNTLNDGRVKGEVDVDVLLKGAATLCKV